ncbi:hypothetical protein OIV83_006214 [Microbotryomycetes sp. JL201]|nr:hypothetical protein OIV83_006214 [Microbotryomycetes sp. JL201]
MSNYGNDYVKAMTVFDGLEARFFISPLDMLRTETNYQKEAERSDKRNFVFIGDGFAEEWVKTPGSVDIVKQSQMFGKATEDKNDVILDLEWELTGRRNEKLTFEVCR